MVKRKRESTVLKLTGQRDYKDIDMIRSFVSLDGTVYGVRKTNEKKLVKVSANDVLLDLWTFDKNCFGGFKTSKGTIFVGVSTRISAQSNYPTEIWRSIDNGVTFTKVFTTKAGGPIFWSWAEDSLGNIYFSEYGYKISTTGANARYVHKSTDNGLTWVKILDTGGMYNSHIHCIAVDPVDDSLFVSIGDTATQQIWRSTDRGDTWKQIADKQHISILFLNEGILWGSDDHTGEITLMKRGTWEETVVYKHKNNEAMWYGLSKDVAGNIYAHGVDEVHGFHYSIIGSPDLSVWRDLDYKETFKMSPFVNGKMYCDGYTMTRESAKKVVPKRV